MRIFKPETTSSATAAPSNWIHAGIFSVMMLIGGFTAPTAANSHAQFVPLEVTSSAPTGHLDVVISSSPAAAILEIRRLSGLNWDELADLFSVSRRSMHFWANGKPLTAANEKRVYEMLSAIRSISGEGAQAVRSKLLSVGEDGRSLADHFRHGYFELAMISPARGNVSTRNYIPLTKSAQRARQPLSVADSLAGELGDRAVDASERLVKKSVRRVS